MCFIFPFFFFFHRILPKANIVISISPFVGERKSCYKSYGNSPWDRQSHTRVTVWLSFSGKAKVETGGPSLLTYDRLESDLYLWWA